MFLELLKNKAIEIFYLMLILPDMIIIRDHGNVPCPIIETLLPLNCNSSFLLLPFKNVCCPCATHVEKLSSRDKGKKITNNSPILLQR